MTSIGDISIASNGIVQGTTHIAFVIDSSTSMGEIRKETIQEINKQIKTIKEEFKDLPTKVSFITFDSYVTEKFLEQDLEVLQELNDNDYRPSGWTAMNDGIGTTISKLKEVPDYSDPNSAYLLIIITDGEENKSRQYDGSQISSMVKELKETGKWTFTLLGANIDIEALSSELSFDRGNVQSFVATAKGVSDASDSMSRGISNYSLERSRGATISKSFYGNNK